MKAITATTGEDNYLFFLPIMAYSWKKIGVDVICFVPEELFHDIRFVLAWGYCQGGNVSCYPFKCKPEQEATYAQCSRLYAAALTSLGQDELLITTDIDMAVFGDYLKSYDGAVQIFGADLLEGEKMFPMCYCSAEVSEWWYFMRIGKKSYQECLDELLGSISTQHMRGNYWCKDQETLYHRITNAELTVTRHNRAKLPERFATRRADRDGWPNEIPGDIIDAHLPRPGYRPANFELIFNLFQTMYPTDDLFWMQEYRNAYKNLL